MGLHYTGLAGDWPRKWGLAGPKSRRAAGGRLTSNLYFCRNNLGDEIEVVIDLGTRLVPVEIKSGETLNTDYFRGLKKWKKMTSDAAGPGYLVNGGGKHLVSEGISVVPWNRAAELIGTKAG